MEDIGLWADSSDHSDTSDDEIIHLDSDPNTFPFAFPRTRKMMLNAKELDSKQKWWLGKTTTSVLKR
jgi:hypothetical protein